MVYSSPRPDAVVVARRRAKAAFEPYRRALSGLPESVCVAITAYTGALSAEAAAQRTRAVRAEAALEALRAERGRR